MDKIDKITNNTATTVNTKTKHQSGTTRYINVQREIKICALKTHPENKMPHLIASLIVEWKTA